MIEDQRIRNEVDKTLHVFESDDVLKGNPFLANRILAENEARARKAKYIFPLRMNLRYIVMLLLLLMNLVTIVWFVRSSQDTMREKLISGLKDDFQIE